MRSGKFSSLVRCSGLVLLLSLIGLTIPHIAHAAKGGDSNNTGSPRNQNSSGPHVPVCSPSCEELLKQARQLGSVRVIVTIDIPDLPAVVHMPREQVARLNQARMQMIANAQRRLLNAMAKHTMSSVVRLKLTPAISIRVGAAGLRMLIRNRDVVSIVEDGFAEPLLPQSTPLIGADGAWAKGFTGPGQNIAILDTGIDVNHSFLRDGTGSAKIDPRLVIQETLERARGCVN